MDQFVASEDFPGHDILKKVLEVHSDEFTWLPDGRIWFSRAPVPVCAAFSDLQGALEFAFSIHEKGATIEELRRTLCLSVCDEGAITRLAIAKELAARPDLYGQIQRGKYAMMNQQPIQEVIGKAALTQWGMSSIEDEEKPFNAESFFGSGFLFQAE
jgi:hypothetical protein